MYYRTYTFLLVAMLLVVTVRGQEETTCRWRMRLITGSDEGASTNATISAAISDEPLGDTLWSAPDINEYNIRRDEEAGYVPFRQDQEDVFEFQGPCVRFTCFYVDFENSGAGTDPSWQMASVEADVTFLSDGTITFKHNQAKWIGGGFPNTDGVTIMLCT